MTPYDPRRQLERVCERLRTQYNAWALLDERDTSQRPAIRDMAQLIRLFRCARAEYLGE